MPRKILPQLYYDLRQKTYPQEIRFDTAGAADCETSLITACAAIGKDQPPPPLPPPSPPPNGGINPDFAMGLCNYYFRLQRNAKLLGDDSFELERIHDTLEDIEDLLQKHDIECRDPTGREYDPRNEDFTPLGEPQPTRGITRMQIGACECPAVFIHGQLRQRAKGFVLKPQ